MQLLSGFFDGRLALRIDGLDTCFLPIIQIESRSGRGCFLLYRHQGVRKGRSFAAIAGRRSLIADESVESKGGENAVSDRIRRKLTITLIIEGSGEYNFILAPVVSTSVIDKDTALKNKKKVKFFSERYFCHICIRQAGPLFRAR